MHRICWIIFVSFTAVLGMFPDGRCQENSRVTAGDLENILPLWEQARFVEKQLSWRQEHVVAEVMRRYGADLWIVGKDEGVLYLSLVPGNPEGLVREEPDFLVFIDRGKKLGVERIASDLSGLSSLIESVKPAQIAVSESNLEHMRNILLSPWTDRQEDSRKLRIGFLEVENHPSIIVQRSDADIEKYDDPPEYFHEGRTNNAVDVLIRRGDVISCDSDLFLLGLVTGSHQHAYVLREGETDVPEA
jgi:hypothetical protein